jgi:hypothetical protein
MMRRKRSLFQHDIEGTEGCRIENSEEKKKTLHVGKWGGGRKGVVTFKGTTGI